SPLTPLPPSTGGEGNRQGERSPQGVGPGGDFLVANDAWFMPVVQKVGPDGCMYILDWYDRYHCYQDANRDPAGIDRLHGRLYRVVYGDYKPAGKFDLAKESVGKLIDRLEDKNVFFRELAQRNLAERVHVDRLPRIDGLLRLIADPKKSEKTRQHAIWAVNGMWYFNKANALTDYVPADVYTPLLEDSSPAIRASGIRSLSNVVAVTRKELLNPHIVRKIASLAKDPAPEVKVQVAIASRQFKDPLPVLLDVLATCGDDKLIPHIVWQNLHPLLEKDGERFLTLASKANLSKSPGLAKVLPRAIDRILGNPKGDPAAVVGLVNKLTAKDPGDPTAALCLTALGAKVQNGEIAGPALVSLRKSVVPLVDSILDTSKNEPLRFEASILSVTVGNDRGKDFVKAVIGNAINEERRMRALDALIASRDASLKDVIGGAMRSDYPKMPSFRGLALGRLGKLDDPWVAALVLDLYPKLSADEQAKSVELLTQRPSWAKSLFKEIADKKIAKDVINVNQARRLLAVKDADLRKLVEKHWGVPRDGRNPERERIVAQMKALYAKTPGDAKAGMPIFKKLCGQCHKIYGEGVDVGPDITSNGRSDFDQLLSNIFDPSLVIGAGYQAVTVNTKQGLTLTGLVVEDSPQRVVLKVQGGEVKTIARGDVEEQFTSKVSLMPEDLEKQLRPQEIVDLLAFLSLDRPPTDAKAKRIPGTPR
ncbi:MAG TPA: hypothetical protein VFE62_03235, partial [Gemmataceae bacterium]|nr:hypothetical protein [Gemmataceae bacterium]